MTHTPGPWTAEKSGGKGAWIKGSNNEWAALACGTTDENADANAALIAATPDLLAMLKVAQFWLDVDGRFDLQGINAAIAKAEGRS